MGGPERGYDGAKRLSGRKRHILVDTGGLLLAAQVHGANLPDRDGGRQLLGEHNRICRGWSWYGRTVRTQAGSASGSRRSAGGGWRCPATETASSGATDWRRSRAGSWSFRGGGSWSGPSRGWASLATDQQGLRKVAGDRGGDALRRDEQAHAAQVGASSMKRSRLSFAFAKLPLEAVRKNEKSKIRELKTMSSKPL